MARRAGARFLHGAVHEMVFVFQMALAKIEQLRVPACEHVLRSASSWGSMPPAAVSVSDMKAAELCGSGDRYRGVGWSSRFLRLDEKEPTLGVTKTLAKTSLTNPKSFINARREAAF
jgi:hypothetical protein